MRQRLKSLDILKGIGILMIILVHNRHFIMKDMSGLRQLINYGQMGCQIFFMVSGMSLCYSWHHHGTPDAKEIGGFKKSLAFMLSRYLRLAPGFYIVFLINLLLNILFIDILGHSPGVIINREPAAIVTNLLFIHGFFPDYINTVFPGGWYIGTTFILYALFPLLVCVFEKLYSLKHWLVYFIPAILLLINCIFVKYIDADTRNELYIYNNSFLYFFFPNQLPCFSLGILLYFQEKTNFSYKCPLPVSFMAFAAACAASMYLYLKPGQTFLYAVLPSLAGLSFYWLAVCFIHIERHAWKLPPVLAPVAKFAASCGSNSYSMYLVHAFISWYGLKDMTYFLTQGGYGYNDLRLYLIMYLPSVFVIYVLGLYMKMLLDRIDKKILKK